MPDAAERGFELLDPAAAAEANPALRGEFAGALMCRRDAIVEPRLGARRVPRLPRRDGRTVATLATSG